MSRDLNDNEFAGAFVRLAAGERGTTPGTSSRWRLAIIGMLCVAVILLGLQSPHGRTTASLGDTPQGIPKETFDMSSVRTSMLALSATLLTAPCIASTIRVPADRPTIQDAVAAATNGDVIELAGGTYTETVAIAGKQITIQRAAGAECVLSASHVSVSATATPGVSFRGIRFTGSTGAGFGAAIEAQDSEISFVGCAFVGNSISGGSGSYGGAAIYARNCRLAMQSTAVTDNAVTLLTGGYPFAFGGAILADRCTLDIRDCSFARNTCSATVPSAGWSEARSMGGAVALRWGSGVIGNCRFESNAARSEVHGAGPLASAFGGAIGATGTPGIGLLVHDCTFTNNRTTAISDNGYYGGNGSSIAGAVCFGYWEPEGGGSHAVRDCLFFESRSDKSPSTNGQSVGDIAFVGVDAGTVERCKFGASSASALTGDAIVGAVVAWGGFQSSLSNSSFCGANCPAYSQNIQATGVTTTESCADCNGNGIPDIAEIIAGAADANSDGVPDSCECPGDLNRDGQVNGADISVILAFWGPNPVFTAADTNHDGIVNGVDLGEILTNWGPCPR